MSIKAISMPFPGVMRVLEEGTKLGYWSLTALPGPVIAAARDIFIFGAWCLGYPTMVSAIKSTSPNSIVGVLWTSSSGEVGFEPKEIDYLKHIIESPDIDFIWFGDKDLAALCDKGFYARYPLKWEPKEPVQKSSLITLFAPMTVKKNLFNQLLAIHYLQRDRPELELWTNVEREYIDALPFRVMARTPGWIPRVQYDGILARSKLNFAVSWAETFCYQAAEAAMLGTPSVLGCELPWMPYDEKVNAYPNDVARIVQNAAYILDNAEQVTKTLRDHLFAESRYTAYVIDEIEERFGSDILNEPKEPTVDIVSTNEAEAVTEGEQIR